MSSKFVIRKQQQSSIVKLFEKVDSLHEKFSNSNEDSTFDRFHSEHRNNVILSENERLEVKITKVKSYWSHNSLMIPNVFRLTCLLLDNDEQMLEYQDLSKKEVLAQAGGVKAKSEPVVSPKESVVFEKKNVQKKRNSCK